MHWTRVKVEMAGVEPASEEFDQLNVYKRSLPIWVSLRGARPTRATLAASRWPPKGPL